MFSISISNARANWIDVNLNVGDELRQFMASSVLNDPPRELANLGVFIATREPGTLGVRFWLEPGGLELRAVWQPKLVLVLYEADDRLLHHAYVLQCGAAELANAQRREPHQAA